MDKKDLENRILDAEHKRELNVIKEVEKFNEDYIENEALKLYLNDLKSDYILEYRKVKNG